MSQLLVKHRHTSPKQNFATIVAKASFLEERLESKTFRRCYRKHQRTND